MSTQLIPIDSLPEELSARKLIRGATFFGLAGVCLDPIAGSFPGMQWWVSDKGLSMAILDPELSVLPPFDELAGRLTAERWKNGGAFEGGSRSNRDRAG